MTGDSDDKQRDEILVATLAHVPFDGWSRSAIRRGGADAGVDEETALRALPNAAGDLVACYSEYADRMMLAELARRDLSAMGMTERIATAVRVRLEHAAPHREAVRRSLAVLALPHNAPLGARCLYRTVDAIWREAGDTSTDWNFYSKRGLLAGVYGTTLLYWLNDGSEDFADTWSFLDRRLRDTADFSKATGKLMERLNGFPRPYSPYRR